MFKLGSALRSQTYQWPFSLSDSTSDNSVWQTRQKRPTFSLSCGQLPILALGEEFLPSPGPGLETLTLTRSPMKGWSFRNWFVPGPRSPAHTPKAVHHLLPSGSRKLSLGAQTPRLFPSWQVCHSPYSFWTSNVLWPPKAATSFRKLIWNWKTGMKSPTRLSERMPFFLYRLRQRVEVAIQTGKFLLMVQTRRWNGFKCVLRS